MLHRRFVNSKARSISLAAIACAALAACGGGGGSSDSGSGGFGGLGEGNGGYPGSATSCDLSTRKQWTNAFMFDTYFWYRNLRNPNASASTIDDHFKSMLHGPEPIGPDRFSYTQPAGQYTQFFEEGKRTGYGYAFRVLADGRAFVTMTEPLSPVAAFGLNRGDELLSINGVPPGPNGFAGIGGVSSEGIPRTFRVRKPNGQVEEFTANSRTFDLSPVLSRSTFTQSTPQGSRRVGYMMFQEFIASPLSRTQLNEAIDAFRSEGVQELILDLRYNGGGRIDTARTLSSLIGGTTTQGRVFTTLKFSDKQSANNFTYSFLTPQQTPVAPLQGINRLFVIAGPGTASASEMVINAFRPFMPVVQIGETTFGKPYGFSPRQDGCGTVFNAVNFDAVNANGVGGYANGLPATCNVADDVFKRFTDRNDARIAAALNYISTGACPTNAKIEDASKAAAERRAEAQILGETSPKGAYNIQ